MGLHREDGDLQLSKCYLNYNSSNIFMFSLCMKQLGGRYYFLFKCIFFFTFEGGIWIMI